MTQYDATHETVWDEPRPVRTSLLAIASLVMSLVCCLPGFPLLGALLGIVALVAIASNAALAGKGLAIAGIVLGLLLTLGQGVTVLVVVMGFNQMTGLVESTLEDGLGGQFDRFDRAFVGTPDREETEAFVGELRERYGDFRSVQMDWAGYQHVQQTAPGEVPLPLRAVFENDEVTAMVVLQQDPAAASGFSILRIDVYDPRRGDLTFPPDAPAPPPTDPGDPPAGEDDAADPDIPESP